jgi:hypothetical protein
MMKSGKRKSGSSAKAPEKTAKRAVPAATKRDARKAAPPTAPASVAKKAAEAIAPVAAVATAAPKTVEKLATATPAPTPASVEPVAKLATQAAALAFNPAAAVAPFATAFEAGADQARASYSRARENGESLRQAVTDSTTATTRAFVELNGKVIDLVRAQSDATLDLWRSTLSAGTFSEAIRVQTHGLREVYETTSAQWKDIAETAGRLAAEAAKPLRTAWASGR